MIILDYVIILTGENRLKINFLRNVSIIKHWSEKILYPF